MNSERMIIVNGEEVKIEQVTRSMDTYSKFVDLTMKWIVSYSKAHGINLAVLPERKGKYESNKI